jgi:hypothetical protein
LGSCAPSSARRTSQLTANRNEHDLVAEPCTMPSRLARVPLGIFVQSRKPAAPAISPLMTPAAIMKKLAEAYRSSSVTK